MIQIFRNVMLPLSLFIEKRFSGMTVPSLLPSSRSISNFITMLSQPSSSVAVSLSGDDNNNKNNNMDLKRIININDIRKHSRSRIIK